MNIEKEKMKLMAEIMKPKRKPKPRNYAPRDLSELIAASRINKSMTQVELAELADVSQANISKAERGLKSMKWEDAIKLLSSLGYKVLIQRR